MENNKKPENPPAFAMGYCNEQSNLSQEGMTLRDYFANSAMQSFLINFGKYNLLEFSTTYKTISKDSYRIADAMLKQREL